MDEKIIRQVRLRISKKVLLLQTILKMYRGSPDNYWEAGGKNGTVAEWLGGGLQNLSQRFESARYLWESVTYTKD